MSPDTSSIERRTTEAQDMAFLSDVMHLVSEHLQDRTNPDLPIRPAATTVSEIRSSLYRERGGEACSTAGRSREYLLEACRRIITWSPRTAHPNFVSQIYSRADLYGVAAEVIVAALNNNIHVFQLSPALTVIERDMIDYLSHVFGFGGLDGAPHADGVFVPGGSAGNMHALYVALHKTDPALREDGFPADGKRFVAFCGEGAHYSVEKAAMVLGIGRSNMHKISSDADGRMRVDLLEAAIAKTIARGDVPFCVCATAGTTVLSAFDPLVPIAEIARRHGIWLHVDAAWGGAAAFSPRHAYLLDGLSEADSLTFSAHKMLGAPVQCVTFLVHARHRGLLQHAMAIDAPYLYQNSMDDRDEEPDLSKNTFQCGRRGDALKFWLMREALGDSGFAKRVDDCVKWAEGFRAEIEFREGQGGGFVLHKHAFSTVCFWYVPKAMRPLRIAELEPGSAAWNTLNEIPDKVRNELIRNSERALVSYGSAPEVPNFFRLGLSSAPETRVQFHDSIKFILDRIEIIADSVFGDR